MVRFGRALALCGLALSGCYTGPIGAPEGTPWDQDDDSDEGGSAGSGGMDEAEGGAGSTGQGDTADGGSSSASETSGASDAGDSGDPDSAGDTAEPPPPVDVPDNGYCEDVAAWDPAWAQLELDVLELVNQARAQGANCGSEGSFGAAPPLTMHPALRCAARKHSKDMNDRMFFDHTNPSGESPWDRMEQAGYGWSAAGENIAGGSPDAAGTMDQWMNSDGHCSNIMNPDFAEIGVGYYPGGQWGTLWTQAFGAQ